MPVPLYVRFPIANANARTFKQGLQALDIPLYPFSKPTDEHGVLRNPKDVCPLRSFDPMMIRGLSPPAPGTPEALQRIPISYATSDAYKWITPTFKDLVALHADVYVEQHRFFAICLDGCPLHFFADLDGKVGKWPQLVDQEYAIDAEMRKLFSIFHEMQFRTSPDMTRWRAAKVPPPVNGEREKTSVHVNLPSVGFRTQQDLHEFMLRFIRWIVTEHTDSILVSKDITPEAARKGSFNLRTATPIDVDVFSPDRSMRCTYSRKSGPGKLPLIPMTPNANLEDELWSSLICYSMPENRNDWVGYDNYPEVTAISPTAARKLAGTKPKKPRAPKPPTKYLAGPNGERINTEWHSSDVESDKGTVAQMPNKDAGDAEKDSQAVYNNRVLPRLEPDVLEVLVSSLSREKRLIGQRNEWRDAIWAIKAACPSDAGRAIAEKWTAGGKPGSSRPGALDHVWNCGRPDSFGVGSIWKWLQEDMTREAYTALRNRLYPPETTLTKGAAADPFNDTDNTASIDACCAAFRAAFIDDEKMNKADELPFRDVMKWWRTNLNVEKRKELGSAGVRAVGKCVLEFCNLFWTLVKLDATYVFYKKSQRAPDDDRAFSFQATTSQSFQKDLNEHFVLDGWVNRAGKVVNVARHWVVWEHRKERNSVTCISPWARPAVQPVPTALNTWVGLRISHERARAATKPDVLSPECEPFQDAANPEWELFRDYICRGFLALETNPAVKIYFLRWFCSQYARPGWKLKVACAMRSARRQIGKSFLGQVLQRELLGRHIACETKAELAFGPFNDVIIGMLFAIVEEFERCSAYNSTIKEAITSDSLPCNPKGKTGYEGDNCLNFYLPGNSRGAFDMDDFAERLFAVNVGDGIYTEGFAHLRGYKWNFVQIARGILEWWHDPANGCVAADGKTVIWRPEDIPETCGALSQRVAGEELHNPVKGWVRAAVNDEVEDVEWGAWNSNSVLYTSFCKYVNNAKDTLAWTRKKYIAELHDLCPTWDKKKQRIEGQSVQCTYLPLFDEARSEFYRRQKETAPPLPVKETDNTTSQTEAVEEDDDDCVSE